MRKEISQEMQPLFDLDSLNRDSLFSDQTSAILMTDIYFDVQHSGHFFALRVERSGLQLNLISPSQIEEYKFEFETGHFTYNGMSAKTEFLKTFVSALKTVSQKIEQGLVSFYEVKFTDDKGNDTVSEKIPNVSGQLFDQLIQNQVPIVTLNDEELKDLVGGAIESIGFVPHLNRPVEKKAIANNVRQLDKLKQHGILKADEHLAVRPMPEHKQNKVVAFFMSIYTAVKRFVLQLFSSKANDQPVEQIENKPVIVPVNKAKIKDVDLSHQVETLHDELTTFHLSKDDALLLQYEQFKHDATVEQQTTWINDAKNLLKELKQWSFATKDLRETLLSFNADKNLIDQLDDMQSQALTGKNKVTSLKTWASEASNLAISLAKSKSKEEAEVFSKEIKDVLHQNKAWFTATADLYLNHKTYFEKQFQHIQGTLYEENKIVKKLASQLSSLNASENEILDLSTTLTDLYMEKAFGFIYLHHKNQQYDDYEGHRSKYSLENEIKKTVVDWLVAKNPQIGQSDKTTALDAIEKTFSRALFDSSTYQNYLKDIGNKTALLSHQKDLYSGVYRHYNQLSDAMQKAVSSVDSTTLSLDKKLDQVKKLKELPESISQLRTLYQGHIVGGHMSKHTIKTEIEKVYVADTVQTLLSDQELRELIGLSRKRLVEKKYYSQDGQPLEINKEHVFSLSSKKGVLKTTLTKKDPIKENPTFTRLDSYLSATLSKAHQAGAQLSDKVIKAAIESSVLKMADGEKSELATLMFNRMMKKGYIDAHGTPLIPKNRQDESAPLVSQAGPLKQLFRDTLGETDKFKSNPKYAELADDLSEKLMKQWKIAYGSKGQIRESRGTLNQLQSNSSATKAQIMLKVYSQWRSLVETVSEETGLTELIQEKVDKIKDDVNELAKELKAALSKEEISEEEQTRITALSNKIKSKIEGLQAAGEAAFEMVQQLPYFSQIMSAAKIGYYLGKGLFEHYKKTKFDSAMQFTEFLSSKEAQDPANKQRFDENLANVLGYFDAKEAKNNAVSEGMAALIDTLSPLPIASYIQKAKAAIFDLEEAEIDRGDHLRNAMTINDASADIESSHFESTAAQLFHSLRIDSPSLYDSARLIQKCAGSLPTDDNVQAFVSKQILVD